MKLEEFLVHAINRGFTITRKDGSLLVSKNGKSTTIKENIDVDYEDFLQNFKKLLPDEFKDSSTDLLPGVDIEGGMLIGPEDPIFSGEVGEKESLRIRPPPLAKYDDITPNLSKKGNKKRSNDPDPDHFKGPGGSDDFM